MKLIRWLCRPVILSLVGVLALALIVGIEGPLLVFDGAEPLASRRSRLMVALVLLLIWALYWIARHLVRRFANVRFVREVEDMPEPPPGKKESEADLATLRQRFEEALGVLRAARVKGRFGKHYLYELPWYMFVGAPGTGKTTALVHSGLRFPLAERLGQTARAAISGVGGTRNCDWFFTDEAVLLDTAGRFTTQDSNAAADRTAWSGFLRLLRKYRPRRPLNGVIVALSVADLLCLDESGQNRTATSVRDRIGELQAGLGAGLPSYVMVTKCDLLAGFTEYFADFGSDEREQVWGMTFPVSADGRADEALGRFPAEFDTLEQQLQANLLRRLQQEPDVQRRALIHAFPQQFAGLKSALTRFLAEAFGGSRFDQPVLLRGVYFTSGTQEGRPIDRMLSAIALALGMQRKLVVPGHAQGRSYFITRLMRDVIFREAGLVGANPRQERRHAWLERAALGVIAALVLLALAGFAISYQRNLALVDTAHQQAERVQALAKAVSPGDDPRALLPLLDAARNLPRGYAQRDEPVPWLERLGLFQGDKLGAEAQAAYARLLQQTLLPLVVGRMTDELRRGDANDLEYQYDVLRAYLMLGDVAHFNARAVRQWANADWRRGPLANATDAERAALDAHLAALFSPALFQPGLPLDRELVAHARATLARMPLAQRAYNQARRDLEQMNLPELSVVDAAGRSAPLVLARVSGQPLTRGVPGVWTREGWRRFGAARDAAVRGIVQDDWVLARQESVEARGGADDLRASVTRLYEEDYIRHWDDFLADVSIVAPDSVERAARTASVLSAPDSPLRLLMQRAAAETTLGVAQGGAASAQAQATGIAGQLGAFRQRMTHAFDDSPAQAPGGTPPPLDPPNPVDAHFQALHDLTGAAKSADGGAPSGSGGASALDAQLAVLRDTAAYLNAADAARRQGQPAPPNDALARLTTAAQSAPPPLSVIGARLSSDASAVLTGGEHARLDALWQTNVGRLCRQAIDGRYPFVRSSSRDAAPDDFGRLFAPGGLIDDFFQKNLAAYVEMSGPKWRWRAGVAPLGISDGVLAQFQRAAQIRDAFFHAGGREVSVRFAVHAVSMDPALDQITLDIDGQQLVATPAQPRWTDFQWPSGRGTGQAHVEFLPQQDTAGASAQGPWALLRLVDAGHLQSAGQPDRFRLSFGPDGRRVVLELSASSVTNPFTPGLADQFRCPDHL